MLAMRQKSQHEVRFLVGYLAITRVGKINICYRGSYYPVGAWGTSRQRPVVVAAYIDDMPSAVAARG